MGTRRLGIRNIDRARGAPGAAVTRGGRQAWDRPGPHSPPGQPVRQYTVEAESASGRSTVRLDVSPPR
ncbi:hypothetical protein SAMN05216371_0398 [Streptomyces sp. TLI_053]|nr:hypothetical protein SAMN05216371_0398 [Streptomyces sp. TLI_053]